MPELECRSHHMLVITVQDRPMCAVNQSNIIHLHMKQAPHTCAMYGLIGPNDTACRAITMSHSHYNMQMPITSVRATLYLPKIQKKRI